MENAKTMVDTSPQMKNNQNNIGKENKKRIIFIALAVVGLVLVVLIILFTYLWRQNTQTRQNTQAEVLQEATKGVLPSVSNNPLENKPNLNPADNTNPIREVKTNPFE